MSMKNIFYSLVGKVFQMYNRIPLSGGGASEQIIVFNTAEDTENLGDHVIMRYCYQVLKEVFGESSYVDISTHKVPNQEEESKVVSSKYKFVCGTNLLTSYIEQWWNWRLPEGLRGKLPYRNVILLGAGWGTYQDECSAYTKMIYQCLLNPNIIHSVRDQYTEKKLKAAGISNVINTGCPTMWNLTPEFCRGIPLKKALDVVTTITDYRRDTEADNLMLKILGQNYRTVYLWLQGKMDDEYLSKLERPSNLTLVPRSLEAYEERLNQGNLDYVGTRLHAGIFALNHKVRSLIIAVDNRAIEIAKDTKLPVILRKEISNKLDTMVNMEFRTEIQIPQDNIAAFKKQFIQRKYHVKKQK